VEHDLVPFDLVADSAAEGVERGLERLVAERLHAAAVVADEVMVMLSARKDGLVARDASADVDALDQPVLRQEIDDAVDAGDPDGPSVRTQRVEDLLRGQAAALPRKEVDDSAPCTAPAIPRVPERREGVLGPLVAIAHERR
jgi:hypothetical protein